MIEESWLNNGIKVKTIWKPLESLEDISPIWQVYGVCFTKDKNVMVIRNPLEGGTFTPWNLPGGTPEFNERPEQTLIREIQEEADISISNIKLLGAFEVFFPNNPNKKKGDHYYQLRYFALIDQIEKQTVDPHDNKMVERKLIPANEFNEYIKWGDVGKELVRVANLEFESNIPIA
jgi:ADP-ribose pyrophosphatase YjhB (NUDIX family)